MACFDRQIHLCESDFCRSQASIDESRERFEGKEDYESLRFRLQKRRSAIDPRAREVDRFLRMMREKGGGSIALAWRRYFDSDGDGELSFMEFCRALASLQYRGDVPGLWRALGGNDSNALGLEALDPENAAILETFSRWCIDVMEGPIEVFRAIDADGSDSLTPDEFAEGLTDLGFFKCQYLPETLLTEELVLERLYPLLDQSGHGCITPDQLLFLEKDKDKRLRFERQLARIREHGADGAPEPLRKDAERFLRTLTMSTTYLGICDLGHPAATLKKTRKQGTITRTSSSLSRNGSAVLQRGPHSGELSLAGTLRRGGSNLSLSKRQLSRTTSLSSVPTLPTLESVVG